jgi:hypothetical protein
LEKEGDSQFMDYDMRMYGVVSPPHIHWPIGSYETHMRTPRNGHTSIHQRSLHHALSEQLRHSTKKICIYVYMYISIYVYTYIYIYTYVYMYI